MATSSFDKEFIVSSDMIDEFLDSYNNPRQIDIIERDIEAEHNIAKILIQKINEKKGWHGQPFCYYIHIKTNKGE